MPLTKEGKVKVDGGADNDFGDGSGNVFGNSSAGSLTSIRNDLGGGFGSIDLGSPFSTSLGYNHNNWGGGADLNKAHYESKSSLLVHELQSPNKSIEAAPVDYGLHSSLKATISSLLRAKREVVMLLGKEPKCPVIKQPDFERYEPNSDSGYYDFEPSSSDQDNMENWSEVVDDENYARAREERRELEREEDRKRDRLKDFEEEREEIVKELGEVVSVCNKLDRDLEELRPDLMTLRFEYDKRKKSNEIERAIEKSERDRNVLEWECEELEDKDELDPLERIDLKFKQKKIENLDGMGNVLSEFMYVRDELEADLEELENKIDQPKRTGLKFDYARYWEAYHNFDFERLEELLAIQYNVMNPTRAELNLELEELENAKVKLQDIQEYFDIEDMLDYHEDEHNKLERDEIDHVRDALDRKYFNKAKQSGIENELDKFKREREEFELELGKFENELKQSKSGSGFEQYEPMKLEYVRKLEETESILNYFKHKREKLDSEFDSLKNESKKRAEQYSPRIGHKEYQRELRQLQCDELKSKREKIEELREVGRVFEECKLELKQFENDLKEFKDECQKLGSNLADPDRVIVNKLTQIDFPGQTITSTDEPNPNISTPKTVSQSSTNLGAPSLAPTNQPSHILTGSINSTIGNPGENSLMPAAKSSDEKVIEESTSEAKIVVALGMMKNLADQHIPYKQETSPRSLRTGETPEALAQMDCSEFVSRYLKELGLFEKVPHFTTADMVTTNFKETYKINLSLWIEVRLKGLRIPLFHSLGTYFYGVANQVKNILMEMGILVWC